MSVEKRIKPAVIKRGPASGAKDRSDFVESEKYGNCIKRCNQKISANPRDERSYIERADAQIYLDHPKEALNDYRRAIEINPKAIKAYYGMATAHVMLGLHKNAMLALTKAMELEQQLNDMLSEPEPEAKQ